MDCTICEWIYSAGTALWGRVGYKVDTTVTHATYEENSSFVVKGLSEFYQHYVVPAADQSIQVFQSFTYGEMFIACLLLSFVLLYMAKWIWEVMR